MHRKIETGRIFERPNRKCVVSPKGNSYRHWVDCVPHPSKALGKGARRVSATGVSEWLRYCSTLQCGSSLRYCSTLQCGSSLSRHCILSECTVARFNLVKQRGLGFLFTYRRPRTPPLVCFVGTLQ